MFPTFIDILSARPPESKGIIEELGNFSQNVNYFSFSSSVKTAGPQNQWNSDGY